MIYVIIPAGGIGNRYSQKKSKLDEVIHGESIWMRSLKAFLNHKKIHHIMIACPELAIKAFQKTIEPYKNKVTLVPGGNTRAKSVHNAFQAIPQCTHVLIHDAARPNINNKLIDKIISSLALHPVVIPGVAITDTVKRILNQTIIKTIKRENLIAVQTPQGFHYEALKKAYERITDFDSITDEAGLMERYGIHGHVIDGTTENIKITTQTDLALLKALIPAT